MGIGKPKACVCTLLTPNTNCDANLRAFTRHLHSVRSNSTANLKSVLTNQVLIYDGDCAFCQRCLDWGLRTLPEFPQTFSYASIQPERFGLALDDVKQSIWLIDPEADLATRQSGKAQLGGHRAAAGILVQQPLKSRFGFGWRMFGYLLILGGPVSAFAYRLVARNRHRLPGATEACELPETKN